MGSLFKPTHGSITTNSLIVTRIRQSLVPVAALFVFCYSVYKCLPNPYLTVGYNPKKLTYRPFECEWTGEFYQCRFGLANSGFMNIKQPRLHLYFIDGADVNLHHGNEEWKKNSDVEYFWSKEIEIPGGIHIHDYAERCYPLDVLFHKSGGFKFLTQQVRDKTPRWGCASSAPCVGGRS